MENPENNINSNPESDNNTLGNSETEKFIEIVHELNYKDVNTEIGGDNDSFMNQPKPKYDMQNKNQPL